MKGIDVIAGVLKAEGTEIVTGFPLNQIFDAVAALGIRPVIARTERVAVNIADGYSRMSGGQKIGVTAVQYGPGSEAALCRRCAGLRRFNPAAGPGRLTRTGKVEHSAQF